MQSTIIYSQCAIPIEMIIYHAINDNT